MSDDAPIAAARPTYAETWRSSLDETKLAEITHFTKLASERPTIELVVKEDGTLDPSEIEVSRFAALLSSGSMSFAQRELQSLAAVAGSTQALSTVTAIVRGVQASDELEGALACQIAATHTLAMRKLAAAQRADDPRTASAHIEDAVKLQTGLAVLVGALNRRRSDNGEG